MITVSEIRGGPGADYYCLGGGEARRMESYWTDAVLAGEPPGRWSGDGAEALGLVGEVDDADMRSVFGEYEAPDGTTIGKRSRDLAAAAKDMAAANAAEPEADDARREEIRKEVLRRHAIPVTGYDFTFSVPKSVTVLHTAQQRMEILAGRAEDPEQAAHYREVREGIEQAIAAGNAAAVEYLTAHAMTRVGRHGGAGSTGRWEHATGLVVASFAQHTSRNIDPQLHTHNTLLNRVLCEDGKWRALDGKDLLRYQHAAGAIGQAVMREHLATMGVDVWERRENRAQEVELVPQATCNALSSRRREIEDRIAPTVARLEAIRDRELSDRELFFVRQELTLATRKGKGTAPAETAEEFSDRLAALCAQDGHSLELVALNLDAHLARPHAAGASVWSEDAVIAEAIAACGETSATFREPDLTAEIMRRLPPVLGMSDPAGIGALATRLTERARAHPALVQVSGRPIDPRGGADPFSRPTDTQYAATFTLEAEQAIRRLAVTRGAYRVDTDQVGAWLDTHTPTIGADQRAAVEGIAASDAALVVLQGPAGTGKSFTMGALAGAWQDTTGGRVIGLATSEVATQVLRDDGIPDSLNVSAFLVVQGRLDAGGTHPQDQAWQLGPRDIVMVDEASMVGTGPLTEVRRHVEAAGARLVLTGDHRQLGAVEAGGAMGLVEGHAETYALSEVRRFAADWERDASLRLRAGDADVLGEYDRHGRLIGYGSAEEAFDAAADAIVADRLDGRRAIGITVSNDDAAAVSSRVRDRLIGLGLVEDGPGVRLGRGENTASVGDQVQARRIDHALGLTNRELYEVTGLAEDGGLDVVCVRTGEAQCIPASYVGADLALAYAGTVHAVQGQTIGSGHFVTRGAPDLHALYPALTRGASLNVAHVILTTGPDDTAPGVNSTATRSSAREVLAGAFAREETGRAATVELEADEERRSSAATILGQVESITRAACRDRLDRHLDDLTADGVLSVEDRARLGADQATEHLSRLLRTMEQAGADPREVLREAVTSRSLGSAESIGQVLAHRVSHGDALPPPTSTDAPADITSEDAEQLRFLRARAEGRSSDLGARTAQDAPRWALDHLGPVPDVDTPERAEWEQRAGRVAAYREATEWTDEHRALGAPPLGPQSTERRAAYLDAWDAAGNPEHARTAALLTDGQIRVRLRAEEDARRHEPPCVDDELKAAERAREKARQDAAIRDREAEVAETAGDAQRAAQLRQEAEAHRADESLHAVSVDTYTQRAAERDAWFGVYGPTLLEADVVKPEAEERGIRPGQEPDRMTAEEWLAADRADREAGDATRTITETDVHDDHQDRVEAADLDRLPEVPHDQEPVLGSEARRLVFGIDCDAAARHLADLRSHDAAEPPDPMDAIRHRWVLDEATDDTADTSDYDADVA